MAALDWVVVISFLALLMVVGLSYTKQSGKSLEQFFLGGRNLPWWLAGLSMVATTFAADTPLAVTELVGQSGIAGNWLWWSFLAGGMLTTFFFAQLWRRAGVLTEVELIELRYSGSPARFLRGFKAVYLGVFMNVIIIGWVNLALQTIFQALFDISANQAMLWVGLVMLLTTIFSSMSGFVGVAVTDAIQFVVAMAGCILLAVLVVQSQEVGGMVGLTRQIEAIDPAILQFFPQISTDGITIGKTLGLSIGAFLAYAGLQWWASWYPGAEPGGGGYVAQRLMSTRSEAEATKATLFFQIAHYCVRPWAWIIVGLAAIVVYQVPRQMPEGALKQEVIALQAKHIDANILAQKPEKINETAEKDKILKAHLPEVLALSEKIKKEAENNQRLQQAIQYQQDNRFGFVWAMRDYLPVGLLGLLVVAFLAAYISTISTQLNWGASYVINDLYKRFLKPDKPEQHYILASRYATLLLMVLGWGVSWFVQSISGAWAFLMQCGAGLGLVLILRWYWWRVNVWSEIAATVAPIVITIPFYVWKVPFEWAFPLTVLFTTIVWVVVTLVTQPTDMPTLIKFYERVRPAGSWAVVAERAETHVKPESLTTMLLSWLLGIVVAYSALFGIGQWIFGEYLSASILTGVVLLGAGGLKRLMSGGGREG